MLEHVAIFLCVQDAKEELHPSRIRHVDKVVMLVESSSVKDAIASANSVDYTSVSVAVEV